MSKDKGLKINIDVVCKKKKLADILIISLFNRVLKINFIAIDLIFLIYL